LCDLLGNVQEWVLDDYFDDYVNALGNGSALCLDSQCQPINQISKVVRGSGWQSTIGNNRSREGWSPLWRSAQIGFRIVKSN
jgi:formylglycine-generating enzyme required for sulfatase activity